MEKFVRRLIIGILVGFLLIIFNIFYCLDLEYQNFDEDITQNFLFNTKISSQWLVRNRSISDESNIRCNPSVYGITEENDKLFFTHNILYKNCSNKEYGDFTFIDDLHCKNNLSEALIISNSPYEEIFGYYDMEYKWKNISEYDKLTQNEWFFGKCENNTFANIKNRFNASAATRALSIQQQKYAEQGNKGSKRTLTVLLIIIDSVSRQSFFRNLNETVNFLNNDVIQKDSEFENFFVVYDFLINNVQGEKTIDNMIPILYGVDESSLDTELSPYDLYDKSDWWAFEEKQKSSIWKYYESQGFITMFSFDTYKDFLSYYTGRKILADHVVSNFWRAAAWSMTGFKDFTNSDQCIGNKYSHEYSLQYLKEYIENYNGYNKFAYSHIGVSHEITGLRLKTADKHLKIFLQELLTYFKHNSEQDIVLLLGSDHGRRSQVITKEDMMEKHLPFQLLISNKNYIERINAHENLLHNSQRLVTRFDWHVTLKHLAHTPYAHVDNKDVSKITFPHNGISLLSEKINDNRTCNDVFIENQFCSCNYIEKTVKDPLLNQYVIDIITLATDAINNFVKRSYLKGYCNEVVLGDIIDARIVYLIKNRPKETKNFFITFQDRFNKDFYIKLHAYYKIVDEFGVADNSDRLQPFKEYNAFMNQQGKIEKSSVQIISISNLYSNYTCKGVPILARDFNYICNCY